MYNILNLVIVFTEKYEDEYVERFANPFPAATRGTLNDIQALFLSQDSFTCGKWKKKKESWKDRIQK